MWCLENSKKRISACTHTHKCRTFSILTSSLLYYDQSLFRDLSFYLRKCYTQLLVCLTMKFYASLLLIALRIDEFASFIHPAKNERQSQRQRRGRVEPFVLSTDEYLYMNFINFYFLLYDVNDEEFCRKIFFISSTLGSENARFRQLINILWLIINYNVLKVISHPRQ